MKVRAIRKGYYGGLLRTPQDPEPFEVKDGDAGTWFEPVDPPAKRSPGRPRQEAKPDDAAELI